MGSMEKQKIKKAVVSPSKPIGLGNIFEIFAQLENIAVILAEFQPLMERLIELLENSNQSLNITTSNDQGGLNEKLTELISIAKETREDSGFVKRIFTQEKPKKTKVKVDKSEAVNQFLLKYNKSMKL
jgi:hypothetical protein